MQFKWMWCGVAQYRSTLHSLYARAYNNHTPNIYTLLICGLDFKNHQFSCSFSSTHTHLPLVDDFQQSNWLEFNRYHIISIRIIFSPPMVSHGLLLDAEIRDGHMREFRLKHKTRNESNSKTKRFNLRWWLFRNQFQLDFQLNVYSILEMNISCLCVCVRLWVSVVKSGVRAVMKLILPNGHLTCRRGLNSIVCFF